MQIKPSRGQRVTIFPAHYLPGLSRRPPSIAGVVLGVERRRYGAAQKDIRCTALDELGRAHARMLYAGDATEGDELGGFCVDASDLPPPLAPPAPAPIASPPTSAPQVLESESTDRALLRQLRISRALRDEVARLESQLQAAVSMLREATFAGLDAEQRLIPSDMLRACLVRAAECINSSKVGS